MRFITVVLTVALFLGTNGLDYSQDKKYSELLPEFKSELSGVNLRISPDIFKKLDEKLREQLEEPEDIQKTFMSFNDDSLDDFEDVNFSYDDNVDELDSAEDLDFELGTNITTNYGKCGFVSAKVLVVSENGTKSFLKVSESMAEGGMFSSSVEGSWSSVVKSQSQGNVEAGVNITSFYNGKKTTTKVTSESSVSSSDTEEKKSKAGVTGFVGNSKITVNSNVQVGAKTNKVTLRAETESETLVVPFGIYVTLFKSSWNWTTESASTSDESGSGMVFRGDVTSRVVFSKNGKSLTKTHLRGYTMSEEKSVCSVTLVNVKSHIWTKLVTKEEDPEDGGVTIDMWTHSRGRTYSRSDVGKKMKVFSGAGLVYFEKDTITVPKEQSLTHQEYAIKEYAKKLTTHGIFRQQGGEQIIAMLG